jgi:hypothetical protein
VEDTVQSDMLQRRSYWYHPSKNLSLKIRALVFSAGAGDAVLALAPGSGIFWVAAT